MKEEPNIEYINQLANGDESIKNRLIEVLKHENYCSNGWTRLQT